MNVLVLRALGLGDLLTAVPALRGLRRTFPNAVITLAAPAWLAPLADEIDAVDRLLPTEALQRISWAWPPPELAVNLHGKGPESTATLQELHPTRLITLDDWDRDQHEVHRWCELLRRHGIPCGPRDLDLPKPAKTAPAATVIHPCASHPARHWPAERYGAVARWLTDHGHRVVITGTRNERPTAQAVAEEAGLDDSHVLAGDTGLSDLAALVAHARLVVCGDTGVAHLATAYGTPSVVLFGPVSPRLWGPPPERPQHKALWAGVSGDTFAQDPSPGLRRITVDEVVEAIGGVMCAASLSPERVMSA